MSSQNPVCPLLWEVSVWAKRLTFSFFFGWLRFGGNWSLSVMASQFSSLSLVLTPFVFTLISSRLRLVSHVIHLIPFSVSLSFRVALRLRMNSVSLFRVSACVVGCGRL